MAKSDTVRGLRIPRWSDADYTLHGSQIVPGTITPAALSVQSLDAISANLGSITTAHIKLGGVAKSYILLSNAPYLRMEAVLPNASRFFHLRADDSPAMAIGVAPIGGLPPFRVDGDGNLTIENGSIEMTGVARTLLQAGVIDLTTGGSYDDADATGIRIKAGWGIASKQTGTQNILWDAATGQISFGPSLKGRINAAGIGYRLNETGYDSAHFSFANSDESRLLGLVQGRTAGNQFVLNQVARYYNTAGSMLGSAVVELAASQVSSAAGYAGQSVNLTAYGGPLGDNFGGLSQRIYPAGHATRSYTRWNLGLGGYLTISNESEVPTPSSEYVAHFYGGRVGSEGGFYSNTIQGGLVLDAQRIGVDDENMATFQLGSLAVVRDAEDNITLRVRKYVDGVGIVEYSFDGTEAVVT